MTSKTRWFEEWDRQHVGFVVETRHGKFKPFIGQCLALAEDDDCIIRVSGSQPPQDTMEEALAFYKPGLDKFKRVFVEPQESGGIMGHWLRPMLSSEGESPWKSE